ncbi:MAG: sulfatase-like hydrolase/transferase [Clostridia bacterium]|nr:sulfatase-like hydrolase/transferase [Clostridia bacterium]
MRENRQTLWHRWLVLPVNLIFMEIIIRICAGGRFFDVGLLFVILNSIVLGGILTALVSFFSEKVNRRIMIGVQVGLSVWYIVQIIYQSFFGKFMILYSIMAGGADQVIASGLIENTVGAILGCWWAFILLALPVAGVVVYTRSFAMGQLGWKGCLWRAGLGIVSYCLILLLGLCIPAQREIQLDAFNKERSVKAFGLLRAELMDIRCNVLGLGGTGEIEPEVPVTETPEPEEIKYADNVMSIDFEALAATETDQNLKELHEYFALQQPTQQNEYTGMFEGYNLIQITAEGFSPYAIDKELTPTLYKMQTEGFNFTQFYTPIWEVSTFDGEYAATTGLVPKSGVWSYYLAGQQDMLLPFTMPQQFLHSGTQTVRAYHNHSYSYYHRDVSHPNLGYIYKGIGNGLETEVNGKVWPESDLEMIEATVEDYLGGEQPFMTYYMTVSGHMEYNFDGNSMAYKNRDLVSHLPYSEAVRAYYACNIEFDKAMEKLLSALETAGVADKTVIVITPDHYPYGLEDSSAENPYMYFDEVAGHSVETNFELYKSSLIIYCPSMEPITVDKVCGTSDIIPTLNNLFGFEYDSRLLMGKDILSDAQPLVLFLNRSWITDKGRYNAETKEFELFAGQTVENEQEYVENIKRIVSNKFKVSAQMLENNYYAAVTGREHYYSK